MTEPDVTLTDYFLALEASVFAYLLWQRGRAGGGGPAGEQRRWWALFFAAIAAAAAAGGTVHGFLLASESRARAVLWPATLIALGAAALAAWALGARLLLLARAVRLLTGAAAAQFALYAGVVLWGAGTFALAVFNYLPATLFLLLALAVRCRRHRERAAGTALAGMALTVAAAAVQRAGIGLHPRWFNHNALYHLIQAAALALIFAGARRLGAPRPAAAGAVPGNERRPARMACCFLLVCLLPTGAYGPAARPVSAAAGGGEIGVEVNDIHSRLNRTRVAAVVKPRSLAELRELVRRAGREGRPVSIAGGRHAMGGQQFGAGTTLIDMTGLDRVLSFDSQEGWIEVEAGIQWPELIDYLVTTQQGRERQWGIIQKQTGADRLTIGGAISVNAHGRGLRLRPFVADVESVVLVDAQGGVRVCSRKREPELFSLVAGGYGLFGVIYSARVRLQPRVKLERVVELADVEDLMPAFERRIAEGYLYGDFQFSIDEESAGFLKRGVFSSYRPVSPGTPIPGAKGELDADDWRELYLLAHTDRRRAFEKYSRFYLSTTGQIYWSDTHQLSVYVDDYHAWLDRRLSAPRPGSEMISEVYVPRDRLPALLEQLRRDFRDHDVRVIYGTIRLIERDRDSFLAWARQDWAATVLNLHTPHTPEGLEKAARDFRRVIDRAIEQGGSFFLTYHRWASREQIEACYPRFREFLELKRKYDPAEVFQSDWYRHMRELFATSDSAPAAGGGGW